MAFLSRKKNQTDSAPAATPEPEAPVEGVRANGPWDASEKSVEGESAYMDFGSLKVRGRVGFEVRLQADGDTEDIGSAVVVTEDAALELRAFASSRSGGLWEDVRADLIEEIERLDGTYEVLDGVYGPELHLRIPVTMEDGEQGFQPSRIVVVEGPRWMLRGTFLGRAAMEPSDDDLLFTALREVVVERGTGPMASRDPLYLTAPTTRVVVDPDAEPTPE